VELKRVPLDILPLVSATRPPFLSRMIAVLKMYRVAVPSMAVSDAFIRLFAITATPGLVAIPIPLGEMNWQL
jgi:hypothetical protein